MRQESKDLRLPFLSTSTMRCPIHDAHFAWVGTHKPVLSF
jgi:hypothetical protein